MPRYDDDQLAGFIQQEIQKAEGGDQDEVASVRETALDYYYERPNRFPAVPGRSAIVSGDVQQMVNSVLAAMLPMVAIDSVAQFEPDGEDDEDQARLESQVVNHMIMEHNRGYVEFHQAIKDALMLRTAVMRVWVESPEEVRIDEYDATGLTDEDIAFLLTPEQPRKETKERLKDSGGNVRIKTTTTNSTLNVGSVDPGNFLYAPNHDSIFLDNIRFCAERQLLTRSELIARDYSPTIVNQLPMLGSETKLDVFARNRNFEPSYDAQTMDQDIIEVYEVYLRLDMDSDGISELWRIVYSNHRILDKAEAGWIPYAIGTPFISSHRLLGESLSEKLKHVQDVKTATLRQWLDNLNVNNNARIVVAEGQVNMDDAMTSRPGGVIRAMSADAVQPLPTVDVGPSAMSLLEYMDRIRAERGGASLDMQNADRQMVNRQVSFQTLDRQYSVLEQLAEMMSRNLAETLVRSVYVLTHQVLRLSWGEPVQARLAGQWVTVNPSDWRPRDRVNVTVGLSPGQRSHRQQVMVNLVQWQLGVIQQGMNGIVTDISGVHDAMLDYLNAAGVSHPEQYLIDPKSQGAQQAAQQQQEQQAQQEQMMMEMQGQMVQMQLSLEQAKLQLDKYKSDQETAFKYYDARLQAETKEAEIVGGATRDLEIAQLQGEQAERQAAIAAERSNPGNGAGGG